MKRRHINEADYTKVDDAYMQAWLAAERATKAAQDKATKGGKK